MSSTIHPIVPSDPENFNQNRYSSVSFDSSKSGCELAKVFMQIYSSYFCF